MANRGNASTVYAFELQLQYWTAARSGIPGQVGEGMTIAISSRLVRFRSDQNFAVGCKILLEIAWPAKLPGGVGLNLCICGGVTQSASAHVEVAVWKYEFRTRRSQSVGTRPTRAATAVRVLATATTLPDKII